MDKIKAIFIAVFTVISSLLGILAVPIYIQTALHIIDYITGLLAAPYRDQKRSSMIGLRGIVKKICLLLLVGVGVIIDWLIMYAGSVAAVDFKFNFVVASLISVWVICNELLSILENIADIGVKLPPFLHPVISAIQNSLKSKTELGGKE